MAILTPYGRQENLVTNLTGPLVTVFDYGIDDLESQPVTMMRGAQLDPIQDELTFMRGEGNASVVDYGFEGSASLPTASMATVGRATDQDGLFLNNDAANVTALNCGSGNLRDDPTPFMGGAQLESVMDEITFMRGEPDAAVFDHGFEGGTTLPIAAMDAVLRATDQDGLFLNHDALNVAVLNCGSGNLRDPPATLIGGARLDSIRDGITFMRGEQIAAVFDYGFEGGATLPAALMNTALRASSPEGLGLSHDTPYVTVFDYESGDLGDQPTPLMGGAWLEPVQNGITLIRGEPNTAVFDYGRESGATLPITLTNAVYPSAGREGMLLNLDDPDAIVFYGSKAAHNVDHAIYNVSGPLNDQNYLRSAWITQSLQLDPGGWSSCPTGWEDVDTHSIAEEVGELVRSVGRVEGNVYVLVAIVMHSTVGSFTQIGLRYD